MQGPTFTPHPTYRVRQGPADETSDEGEEESFHGRPYARTPFPGQRYLGSPGSQNGGFIIPGGHQRSASQPVASPLHPGSEFGSPVGSPEEVERGPFQPPQPHVQPTKSAMRRTHRRTMDGFGTPPFGFPQADQLPPPGANPYLMGPTPYVPGQNGFIYPGLPPMPHPSQQFGVQPPFIAPLMGPPPLAVPPPSPMGFPIAGGQVPMVTAGYPPGVIPQPGIRPHVEPMYQSIPDSQRGHKRRRKRRDSHSSESSSEGVVPGPRHGNANPIPQPPRTIPVPVIPPNRPVIVDSPPATRIGLDAPPPIPPKPPPNPLPAPPKAVIENAQKSAALAAAAEDVKRAKERTERARDKAIARLEADTWAAAGVPVGVTEDGEPHVPLIPGATAPAILSNVERGRKNEEEGEQHKPLGGLTSLLKRMSTRRGPEGPPPPVAPKPAKRVSTQPTQRPSMPTYNSSNVPRDEGVFPRGAGLRLSASMSHLPLATELGQVANEDRFVYPHTPGIQTPMQYDPQTQEYFDPSNGLWWNPNTRKYYNRRAATLTAQPPKRGTGKEKEGGGLLSMIKRWTTNTAPDHQPKPITAQLVLPAQPGAAAGLKGVKAVGSVPPIRKSMQQQQIAIYPDHQQALNGRRRANSAVGSKRGTLPWGFPPGTAGAIPSQSGVMPNDAVHPWPPGMTPAGVAAASAGVSRVPSANVYFSRKTELYGGFRLDSAHPVNWGGVEAPTALHWFESGRFENVGTGLGAAGMETGWTMPSTLGLRFDGDFGKTSRFFKALGKGGDEGSKKARMEYIRARTEESEHILRLRTARDIQVASTRSQLEGHERRDWLRVWQTKLEEILYLKFRQHPDLRDLLVRTGTAQIIFNNEDSILGDGGTVNGNSGNGQNELGKALVRVRYTIMQQLAEEVE